MNKLNCIKLCYFIIVISKLKPDLFKHQLVNSSFIAKIPAYGIYTNYTNLCKINDPKLFNANMYNIFILFKN